MDFSGVFGAPTPRSDDKGSSLMKDKCVLVTGATKGIGRALTQRLVDIGCHVVGIARNTTDVDFPVYLYACDLSDSG